MINTSADFIKTVIAPNRNIGVKAIFNNNRELTDEVISVTLDEISFSESKLKIGEINSNKVTVKFKMPLDKIPLKNGSVKILSGINGEYINKGTYYIAEISKTDNSDIITVMAYDSAYRLNKIYEPDIEYPSNLSAVINDICNQCNIAHDIKNIPNITIDGYVENTTCNQFLGYMLGLMGCNGTINPDNKLVAYWYKECGFEITYDLQLMGGFNRTSDEDIVINSLTSGSSENVFVAGNGFGITFDNPYMTQEILDDIYEKICPFTYTPCTVAWRGNPALEITDIVKVQDKEGNFHNVLLSEHSITLTGIKSSINCKGETEINAVMNQSPTEIKINKLYGTLTDAFKNTTDKILGNQGGYFKIDVNENGFPSGWSIMNTPELRDDTCLWKFTSGGLGYSENGGKTFKNIAFDLDGNFNANAITTGVLQGEMFELDLQSGVIRIGKRDDDGEISNPSFYLNENGELKINGFNAYGENLIHDSIGVFNDGSWEGDFNVDSTPETRIRNMYGYALLLKNGSLKQHIQVINGTYTLSFTYKKILNLAKVKIIINGEEFILSNNDYTEFKHTFTVATNSVEIEFVSDTDNCCPVINLMLNKGDEKMEWTLNPNETWSDTVQIGRGIRISSSGTDVVFVANADIIGFMNKQGEYIATFDDEGLVANAAVIKNKATIVNLLIQDINDQTVINRINSNEVEAIDNG